MKVLVIHNIAMATDLFPFHFLAFLPLTLGFNYRKGA